MWSRPVVVVFVRTTFWLIWRSTTRAAFSTYDFVLPEEVAKLVDEHIVAGERIEKRKAKPYYNQFVDAQRRIVMSGCGQIDAESLDAYLAEDGFRQLKMYQVNEAG